MLIRTSVLLSVISTAKLVTMQPSSSQVPLYERMETVEKKQEQLLQIVLSLHGKIVNMTAVVSRLTRQGFLPPIRKPIQGKDYIRTFIFDAHIDKEIKTLNSGLKGEKYLEFDGNVQLTVHNSHALACLENLLNMNLS